MCRLRGVRQLCDAYWASPGGRRVDGSMYEEPNWFDFEGTVTSQNGDRSWLVADSADGSAMLLRASAATIVLRNGNRIRALNLLRGRDQEAPVPIGCITQASELFLLEDSS
jgi:hypothetical protein